MSKIVLTPSDVDQLLNIASDTLDQGVLTVIDDNFITEVAADLESSIFTWDEPNEEELKEAEERRAYNSEFIEILKELKGFYLKLKVKGYHRNDSQLVDYALSIYRPDNTFEVKFEEEMCLMFGFDYDGPNVTINK